MSQYTHEDGTLVVRLDKAIYGLTQLAKLWYKELLGSMLNSGFKKCPSDECVFMKKMSSGKYVVILLYVNDVLVMSELPSDNQWVKNLLEEKYKKIAMTEDIRLPYLGMAIMKTQNSFEICMRSYIEEILKLYGKRIREYVVPAMQSLFSVDKGAEAIKCRVKFHSIVAKLLYLGKRGRPHILMPIQFFCTRVKSPNVEDEWKLERVLGYLQLTKAWTRTFDKSPFERITTYIDESFMMHEDGKSQSACLVMMGNPLVQESCRKQQLVTKTPQKRN
jgi:hypothetical protein